MHFCSRTTYLYVHNAVKLYAVRTAKEADDS